jgi:Mn2+/Fe2+ NRAMP family transporter
MGAASAIIGAIGGLCAVLGIVTAADVVQPIAPEFSWIFWFSLAAILLLASIALAVGRRAE